MTTNLNYCFIKASPGNVRRAWKRWAGGMLDNVYFVPAQGGCFLVTLKSVSSGPMAWLQMLATGFMNPRPVIERFKADFENGRAG